MAIRYAKPTHMRNLTHTQSPAKAIARIFGSVALSMLLLFGAMLASQPADAQQLCLLRADAVNQLKDTHKEQVVSRGLVQGGHSMLEVFASESGNWTAVVTDTQGRSCVVANGESWIQLPLIVGDPA